MSYNRNQITGIRLKRYVMENRMFTVGKSQSLYLQSHILFFPGRNVYFNVA